MNEAQRDWPGRLRAAGLVRRALLAVALLATAATAAARDPAMAMIVTSYDRPAQCISPIAVHRIDGEEVQVPTLGFEIEPGIHSLNGRATLNLDYCKTLRGNEQINIPDLETVFEAGKTYYVGFDHSAPRREDWRLVVWKTENR